MAATLLNTKAALDGKTVMVLETAETITALKTFDRDPNAPFAVTASSAVVTNLDADLWDGFHATTYTGASTIVTLGTITTGVWNAGAVTSSGAGTFAGDLMVGNTTGNRLATVQSTSNGGSVSYKVVGKDSDGTARTVQFGLGLFVNNAFSISDGTTEWIRMVISTGVMTFSAYGAGTATFSAAGVISSVSDERLKDDIRPLGYGLAEVLALDPIRHFWTDASGLNDPAHTEYGSFGAASVKDVMPLAVGRDARGYLTLGDRPILGATVNAIKELHARVTTLEARDAGGLSIV